MGTNIYGSYDELIIELRGLDRWRSGRGEVRIAVDDVRRVRSVRVRTLVSGEGERVLRAGSRQPDAAALVLDLAPCAAFDRIVLALPHAEDLATELRRSGIGAGTLVAS